ncbi:MAG: GntR family transcriptional regulator [Deltaproteobacteria bacterium]|nr:GntR family transcriptional regulator [Deltaproteobacteria bacterium]
MTEQFKLKDDPGLGTFKSLPERKSLGQYVYENLKQAIVKGDLTPGSRVIESRVADALGISRTPVREAIHKLEREGLLRHNPTGGFFVPGLTRADTEETFGIRSVLESYAAKLAAIKHREEELYPLEKKINEFQRCLDRKEMDALLRINTEFHDLLYALSRSPRLIKMINDLSDQIYRFRRVILRVEKMAKTSNKDHRLMLKFIRRRDADGVERLVREHILRGQALVLKEFDKQNME